jgi:hypothetical protein
MALELTSYDLLPQHLPSFARGFAAALIATVTCYPLDTIRRTIQLQAGKSVAWHIAAGGIVAEDGLMGLYRGFVPNALKNLPNKGEQRGWEGAAAQLGAVPAAARGCLAWFGERHAGTIILGMRSGGAGWADVGSQWEHASWKLLLTHHTHSCPPSACRRQAVGV